MSDLSYSPVGNDYNISWSAPFSLDVPSANPDITYCLNVHDQFSTFEVAKCNLSTTHYLLLHNNTRCNDLVVQVIAMNPVGNSTATKLDIHIQGNFATNIFFFLCSIMNYTSKIK